MLQLSGRIQRDKPARCRPPRPPARPRADRSGHNTDGTGSGEAKKKRGWAATAHGRKKKKGVRRAGRRARRGGRAGLAGGPRRTAPRAKQKPRPPPVRPVPQSHPPQHELSAWPARCGPPVVARHRRPGRSQAAAGTHSTTRASRQPQADGRSGVSGGAGRVTSRAVTSMLHAKLSKSGSTVLI